MLQKKTVCTSEQEVSPRNTILQLSTPYISTIFLDSPHLKTYRHWCHLAHALKTYCEQVNR